MSIEPGLDLHDWETRWQQLVDAVADSPYEAITELVRLAEQMLVGRGYSIDDPVADDGLAPELRQSFLAARDVARAADNGDADPGDVGQALEDLADVHDFLVGERAAP
jgi:hypothetical protein